MFVNSNGIFALRPYRVFLNEVAIGFDIKRISMEMKLSEGKLVDVINAGLCVFPNKNFVEQTLKFVRSESKCLLSMYFYDDVRNTLVRFFKVRAFFEEEPLVKKEQTIGLYGSYYKGVMYAKTRFEGEEISKRPPPRKCFGGCGYNIHYITILIRGIREFGFSLEEMDKMWNSKYVKFLCCKCFKKQKKTAFISGF